MVHKYYQKYKERQQKEAREIYQSFAEEEKEKMTSRNFLKKKEETS